MLPLCALAIIKIDAVHKWNMRRVCCRSNGGEGCAYRLTLVGVDGWCCRKFEGCRFRCLCARFRLQCTDHSLAKARGRRNSLPSSLILAKPPTFERRYPGVNKLGAMSERVHFSQTGQKRRLVAFFVAWKCLLLVITLSSPGPGYDTSSLILVNPSEHRHSKLTSRPWLDRIALNLFRWDSFYFIKTAQRGYVHEQEWAFSWVYSAILKKAVTCERLYFPPPSSRTDWLEALSGVADPSLLHFVWAGVAVSNISHLVSVLILFKLSNVLLGNTQGSSTSLIACILHILSPAGLFLIAPYSEALFAALNFGGMLCYVQARVAAHSSKSWTVHQDAGILSSAVLFGLATWIRGNGLLSGLVFLFDVASAAPSIVRMQPRPNDLRRVIVTFVAGVLLGTMYVFPQYIAYREYCSNKEGSEARPWCHRAIPSIYTWVQGEYWLVA